MIAIIVQVVAISTLLAADPLERYAINRELCLLEIECVAVDVMMMSPIEASDRVAPDADAENETDRGAAPAAVLSEQPGTIALSTAPTSKKVRPSRRVVVWIQLG
jgi:hypothetical protein